MIQRAAERPTGRERGPRPRLPSPSLEAMAMFATALMLRVAYVLVAQERSAPPSPESALFDDLGWNLARGLGFQLSGEGALSPAAKAPMLPYLVGLLYRATGHVYPAALLAQCVVGAILPVLARALGRTLFGFTVGRAAGWLTAVHPLLVYFSGELLAENLLGVAMLAALLASVEWLKTPRPARAVGVGLLWGLACLTQSTAMPMPFVVGLWAWAPLGLTVRPRDRVRQVALLFLGLALTLAPWTIRNAVVLRAFVPITTGSGRALLDANNTKVWDDPARRGGVLRTADEEPWATRFRNRSEVDVDHLASREAIAFGWSRWREWPAVASARLARCWRLTAPAPGPARGFRPGSLPGRVLALADPWLLWSLLVMPFACWGLVRTIRSSRRHFQLLPLWGIAAVTAGSLVYGGSLRLRSPAEPLLLLYAGAGIADVLSRIRIRRSGLALLSHPRR